MDLPPQAISITLSKSDMLHSLVAEWWNKMAELKLHRVQTARNDNYW